MTLELLAEVERLKGDVESNRKLCEATLEENHSLRARVAAGAEENAKLGGRICDVLDEIASIRNERGAWKENAEKAEAEAAALRRERDELRVELEDVVQRLRVEGVEWLGYCDESGNYKRTAPPHPEPSEDFVDYFERHGKAEPTDEEWMRGQGWERHTWVNGVRFWSPKGDDIRYGGPSLQDELVPIARRLGAKWEIGTMDRPSAWVVIVEESDVDFRANEYTTRELIALCEKESR